MISTKEKIFQNALNLIAQDSDNPFFNEISYLYNFANENLRGYYDFFEFKNKKILTVLGSGDHVLNAILLGAKDIDCFDINLLTKYYYELKAAAISILSYKEFLCFFVRNKYYFDYELYRKFSFMMPKDAKDFWDFCYLTNYDFKNSLFRKPLINFERSRMTNMYLKEEEYNELQKKIMFANVEFKQGNILDLLGMYDKLFDYIFLSNISSYIDLIYKNRPLEEFKKLIMNIKSNLLNKNGMIAVGYIYDFFNEHYNSFEINDSRDLIFADEQFTTEIFESARSKDSKDALILTK